MNRLCSEIAQKYSWGIVNVNLRSYYAEGSKTVGFEIAEQLGWRLPQNIVVPMAGGALITKIYKAFEELQKLGWVEPAGTKFLGAQATGCSPITTAANAAALKSTRRSRTLQRKKAQIVRSRERIRPGNSGLCPSESVNRAFVDNTCLWREPGVWVGRLATPTRNVPDLQP